MYAKREKSFPIFFGGYAYFYYVFLVALIIVAYNYHDAIYQYNNFLGIAYIPFAVIFITLFTFLRALLELKAAERTIKEEIEKQFYEANKYKFINYKKNISY